MDANSVGKLGPWAEVLILSPVFFPLYHAAGSVVVLIGTWPCAVSREAVSAAGPEGGFGDPNSTRGTFRRVVNHADTGTCESSSATTFQQSV